MRFLIILFLIFQSNLVNAFELNGEIIQGALIIGKEHPNKSIYINKQKIKLSKNGNFVFGINYNQTGNIVIDSVDKNNQITSKTYKIKKRQYKIQKIDGFHEKMVTPDQESLEIIKKDNADRLKVSPLGNPAMPMPVPQASTPSPSRPEATRCATALAKSG